MLNYIPKNLADIVQAQDVFGRTMGGHQLKELSDVEHLEGFGAGSPSASTELDHSRIFSFIRFEIPGFSQQTMILYTSLVSLYLLTWLGSMSSMTTALLEDIPILCAVYLRCREVGKFDI